MTQFHLMLSNAVAEDAGHAKPSAGATAGIRL